MRTRTLLALSLALSAWQLAGGMARAQTQLWVFTDGKNRGRVVVADAATKAVSPADNPFSRANGSIAVGDFSDCKGPAHYHGTWLGKPDPKPKACGWGHLVLVDPSDLPGQILLNFAQALLKMDQVSDRARTSTLGCSPGDSLDDLNEGLTDVDSALSGLETALSTGGFGTKAIQASIACLEKLRKQFEKLGALVQEFVTNPPLTTAEIQKFCIKYWKIVHKIENRADCFIKHFVPFVV